MHHVIYSASTDKEFLTNVANWLNADEKSFGGEGNHLPNDTAVKQSAENFYNFSLERATKKLDKECNGEIIALITHETWFGTVYGVQTIGSNIANIFDVARQAHDLYNCTFYVDDNDIHAELKTDKSHVVFRLVYNDEAKEIAVGEWLNDHTYDTLTSTSLDKFASKAYK